MIFANSKSKIQALQKGHNPPSNTHWQKLHSFSFSILFITLILIWSQKNNRNYYLLLPLGYILIDSALI